jgi:hypothetical protein
MKIKLRRHEISVSEKYGMSRVYWCRWQLRLSLKYDDIEVNQWYSKLILGKRSHFGVNQ